MRYGGAGGGGGGGSSCSVAEDGDSPTAAMMHVVTEDTPPDMLAGAMTLSVSLPDGRDVNMSVERSTPMMDLLVQVTTAYKLRPSDHILQAIDMSVHYDKVLPYKPNTPIGALDTQCIRVLPKGRSLPAPRQIISPGHQPFESTFRLQVHLPRNQFCVIRVGKHCQLEEIMKKVCEEKNLDPRKYEFRHPANIDQVLDPKRTLSDYEITEITVVPRGSGRLPQTLSSTDIMALQREEERRKMQAKTGGGVLNLIFRRGKNSMGSGSISSDTRSISPTQSDDSRSVTPPAVQPTQILSSIPQEKPKAPLRKRRPAPKPPQNNNNNNTESKNDKQASQQNLNEINTQKHENGLTICHSRNSSDSSGYHEASILSDNCNTTLPRRPKSMAINSSGDSALGMDKTEYRKSTGNLNNMTLHSKSTTSLTTAGRKKKAPPPPPSLKAATSLANIATTSSLSLEPMTEPQPKSITEPNTPVVASDEPLVEPKKPVSKGSPIPSTSTNRPKPLPRLKPKNAVPLPPVPVPRRSLTPQNNTSQVEIENLTQKLSAENLVLTSNTTTRQTEPKTRENSETIDSEEINRTLSNLDHILETNSSLGDHQNDTKIGKASMLQNNDEIKKLSTIANNKTSPTNLNSIGRHTGFQVGKSLLAMSESDNCSDTSSIMEENNNKIHSILKHDLEIEDMSLFDKKNVVETIPKEYPRHYDSNRLEINDLSSNKKYEDSFILKKPSLTSLPSVDSVQSLRSIDSLPTFLGSGYIKKWDNVQNLDGISIDSSMVYDNKNWDLGDSDADSSMCPTPNNSARPSIASVNSTQETLNDKPSLNETSQSCDNKTISNFSNQSSINSNIINQTPPEINEIPNPTLNKEDEVINETTPLEIDTTQSDDLEIDWQYQLPSPPQEFRDMSPTNITDVTNYDTLTYTDLTESLVAPPPIFDSEIKENRSEAETISVTDSVQSSILASKYISLETLEKRKSLVLERELSSLKNVPTDLEVNNNTEELKCQKSNLISEVQTEIRNRNFKNTTLSRSNSQPSQKLLQNDSTLPNFKITTYENQPKAKISIFEDETIRSNEKRAATLDKRNSAADINVFYQNYKNETYLADKRNSLDSASSDNLMKMKSLDDNVFKKPLTPQKNNVKGDTQNGELANNVLRSESFSKQNGWTRSTPVKRSKSQVSLERYNKDDRSKIENSNDFKKSSSMWNVSGLQSLEVMRMILPKLESSPPSTPTMSKSTQPVNTTTVTKPESPPKVTPTPEKVEPQVTPKSPEKTPEPISKPTPIPTAESDPKPRENNPELSSNVAPKPATVQESQQPKVYQYRGPPSINLGTWSERPKSQIQLKEDKDYKISNISAMKARFSSQTNLNTETVIKKFENSNISSVNIRVNGTETKSNEPAKVNINVREGSTGISKIINQTPGNVIIKIGNSNNSEVKDEPKSQNFGVMWRRPFGNVNGVDKPRPRSIAFDSSCPDISRVPIVRSVELKKPFKDVNKTVTQISGDEAVRGPEFRSNTLGNRFSSVYVSTESINNNLKTEQIYSKPVSRVNSFACTRPTNTAPVVRGFRFEQPNEISNKTNNNTQWNGNSNSNGNHYNTLPSKPSQPINHFSQSNLKKTNNLSNLERFNNSNNFNSEKVVLRNTRQMTQPSPSRNSTGSLYNTVGLPNNGLSNHTMTNGGNIPPPPPVLPTTPKITSVTKKMPRQMNIDVDPRDQLLSAIRNFGGKAGLKSIK